MKVSPALRESVFARDGARCASCEALKHLTIDHIVPVSAGGTNDPENLQVLCVSCNSSKGGVATTVRVPCGWRGCCMKVTETIGAPSYCAQHGHMVSMGRDPMNPQPPEKAPVLPTTPLMPRKNIWLTEQGLANLATLKERWGCSEGEAVRRALVLAVAASTKKK